MELRTLHAFNFQQYVIDFYSRSSIDATYIAPFEGLIVVEWKRA